MVPKALILVVHFRYFVIFTQIFFCPFHIYQAVTLHSVAKPAFWGKNKSGLRTCTANTQNCGIMTIYRYAFIL